MSVVAVHFWAFVGIAAVVIIVPGPDTALVTKNALLHGRRSALYTALGVTTGLVIWTIGAAAGVAAVLRASAFAFAGLKLLGAAYLIWLGAQALRAARHGAAAEPNVFGFQSTRGHALVGFRQGVLSNLANPKIAVFFTSLLPQFVSSRESILVPSLLLGNVFVLMTVLWLCGYAIMAAKASDVLTRPRVKASLDRITGLVLIGFGVRLALERR